MSDGLCTSTVSLLFLFIERRQTLDLNNDFFKSNSLSFLLRIASSSVLLIATFIMYSETMQAELIVVKKVRPWYWALQAVAEVLTRYE
jgi:hypothetical protein